MQYNYKHEGEAVKVYPGRTIDKMSMMKTDGRVPISIAWFYERRLLTLDEGKIPAAGEAKTVAETYWENYADTVADGAIRHPDGKAKIVLDSVHLRDLTPGSKLANGGFILKDADIYEVATGSHVVELTTAEVEKYTGKDLSKAEVLNNRIHRILARHPDEVPATIARDKDLLKEYANAVFSLAKQKYGYDENMGVFLPDPKKVFILRFWCVYDLYFRSHAYGGSNLNVSYGRALGVHKDSLESLVAKRALHNAGGA